MGFLNSAHSTHYHRILVSSKALVSHHLEGRQDSDVVRMIRIVEDFVVREVLNSPLLDIRKQALE